MLGSKSRGPRTEVSRISLCETSVWSQKTAKMGPGCKANRGVHLVLPGNNHGVGVSLGIFRPQMSAGRLVIFRVIPEFEEVSVFAPSRLTALRRVSWFPRHQLAKPDLAGAGVETRSNGFTLQGQAPTSQCRQRPTESSAELFSTTLVSLQADLREEFK